MAKILILTAGYGAGHNTAAFSMREAFEEMGHEVLFVDLFSLHSPTLFKLSRWSYVSLVTYWPKAWILLFRWLDRSKNSPKLFKLLVSQRRLLGRIIKYNAPDVIVSTFPSYAWLLNQLRDEGMKFCNHYTIVTDSITINSLWYKTFSAGIFVSDKDSFNHLTYAGIPTHRLHLTGFPVNRLFADRPIEWQPTQENPRILFIVSAGTPTPFETAEALFDITENVVVIVPHDKKLRERLLEKYGCSRVFGWTTKIPEFLMMSNFVITKAGGAIVQEALAAGCPMIITHVIGGQEEGNFILAYNMKGAEMAKTTKEIIDLTKTLLLNNSEVWYGIRNRLMNFIKPNAARTICNTILKNEKSYLTRTR